MTDLLLVSLGSTAGLRAADAELCGALERAGASVTLVAAQAPRDVRTFMATDLAWARAARAAAVTGIAEHAPRAVIYSTTTAALLAPRPGAIRFDALAAETRPGRHGLWQRPVEARRLRGAALLVPMTPQPALGAPAVVVPIPVEPSGPTGETRDIAALTYGANWRKKGLDRVLAAWALSAGAGAAEGAASGAARRDELVLMTTTGDATRRADGESAGRDELVVAGVAAGLVQEAWRAGGGSGPLPASVRVTGPLPPAEYRALLRRARVFLTAPRREDYGVAQLEALADGCALVTTAAPGPYAALPLARALDARLVVPNGADPARLATALATALDATGAPDALGLGRPPARPTRREPGEPPVTASQLLRPFTRAAVDHVVADDLLPRLLP